MKKQNENKKRETQIKKQNANKKSETQVMRQSGTWVLKLRVVATRSTLPDVVENGQERIKTTRGTLFSSWI